MPCRNELPEGVPGSTNASSLNSASGATTLTRISITAGSAVPMLFWAPSARCAATPPTICTPIPSTITINTGVKAAAGVEKEWVTEVGAKGGNGQALLDDARALIRKHGG